MILINITNRVIRYIITKLTQLKCRKLSASSTPGAGKGYSAIPGLVSGVYEAYISAYNNKGFSGVLVVRRDILSDLNKLTVTSFSKNSQLVFSKNFKSLGLFKDFIFMNENTASNLALLKSTIKLILNYTLLPAYIVRVWSLFKWVPLYIGLAITIMYALLKIAGYNRTAAYIYSYMTTFRDALYSISVKTMDAVFNTQVLGSNNKKTELDLMKHQYEELIKMYEKKVEALSKAGENISSMPKKEATPWASLRDMYNNIHNDASWIAQNASDIATTDSSSMWTWVLGGIVIWGIAIGATACYRYSFNPFIYMKDVINLWMGGDSGED